MPQAADVGQHQKLLLRTGQGHIQAAVVREEAELPRAHAAEHDHLGLAALEGVHAVHGHPPPSAEVTQGGAARGLVVELALQAQDLPLVEGQQADDALAAAANILLPLKFGCRCNGLCNMHRQDCLRLVRARGPVGCPCAFAAIDLIDHQVLRQLTHRAIPEDQLLLRGKPADRPGISQPAAVEVRRREAGDLGVHAVLRLQHLERLACLQQAPHERAAVEARLPRTADHRGRELLRVSDQQRLLGVPLEEEQRLRLSGLGCFVDDGPAHGTADISPEGKAAECCQCAKQDVAVL
mmetsp:Transcript_94267/g.293668  ORF Transcript_94267/g.293668 Transcript_94267/m.293668 type:complete len:295 (-) Transcript_94267:223-1107(-)